MIRHAARALLAEPRVSDPPERVSRDWVLLAVVLPAAVVEAVVRDDMAWRVVSLAVLVVIAPMLLWRRTHPLAVTAASFGTLAILDVVSLVAGVGWEGLGTGIFVLLFPYALVRWGAGREIAIGVPIVLVPVALSFLHPIPAGDVIGGAVVVLLAAAIGAAVRYQDNARQRRMEQIKSIEREQLARELHDTVAHHVSAIAIRAQAGRVVGASDPGAALDALVVIEEQASRTLDEMRAMVGALRQRDEPDLAPQRGVADIKRLATSAGDHPRIDVELSGELDRLRPSVDAALYRLAQESITNALRHARHATNIRVVIRGSGDRVDLTVRDDGEAAHAAARSSSGYGLIGMAERAKLLGGTLDAGPDQNRGWTVHAVLPLGGGG